MTSWNIQDWKALTELIKMKNEKPKEYNKLIEDLKDIMKDFMKIAEEIVDDFS